MSEIEELRALVARTRDLDDEAAIDALMSGANDVLAALSERMSVSYDRLQRRHKTHALRARYEADIAARAIRVAADEWAVYRSS